MNITLNKKLNEIDFNQFIDKLAEDIIVNPRKTYLKIENYDPKKHYVVDKVRDRALISKTQTPGFSMVKRQILWKAKIRIVKQESSLDAGKPPEYYVYMKIDNQSFDINRSYEELAEAQFIAKMLAKALHKAGAKCLIEEQIFTSRFDE